MIFTTAIKIRKRKIIRNVAANINDEVNIHEKYDTNVIISLLRNSDELRNTYLKTVKVTKDIEAVIIGS